MLIRFTHYSRIFFPSLCFTPPPSLPAPLMVTVGTWLGFKDTFFHNSISKMKECRERQCSGRSHWHSSGKLSNYETQQLQISWRSVLISRWDPQWCRRTNSQPQWYDVWWCLQTNISRTLVLYVLLDDVLVFVDGNLSHMQQPQAVLAQSLSPCTCGSHFKSKNNNS